jgi:hypothetical protein
MQGRAKEGACLAELVMLAIAICQQAEQACPRRGPGRKPEFPDWQMAVLIMVAIAKRKKSKSAQYRYLEEHQNVLAELMNTERFPGRTTYFDRYRRASTLFTAAIRLLGAKAVRYGWADAEVVAVDKSLVAARGRVRHRHKGRNRRVGRGVDRDARWSRNEHDGWVYGYGYEVVVTCGKNGVLWPVLASADQANRAESVSFREKIPDLPRQTRYVLADRGYDADDNCEAIEWTDENRRTGRRYLCPTIERFNARRERREAWKESRERKRRRTHREARKKFLQTKRGKALYARRSKTVEPFNSWFKALFELEDRVWHRGLDNNRTQLTAALFTYQLLLEINHKHGKTNGQIKWILDAL